MSVGIQSAKLYVCRQIMEKVYDFFIICLLYFLWPPPPPPLKYFFGCTLRGVQLVKRIYMLKERGEDQKKIIIGGGCNSG